MANVKPNALARPLAHNVELVRQRLLERLSVPPEILNRTLKKLDEKLDAKETKFFTYQGQVVEQVDVEDHATQLSAIDKVLSLSGMYARERNEKNGPARVKVVFKDGVLTMVIGDDSDDDEASLTPLQDKEVAYEVTPSLQIESHPGALASGVKSSEVTSLGDSDRQAEPQVQVIKRRAGNLPLDVYNALFGDEK